jgi:hypothetical protein
MLSSFPFPVFSGASAEEAASAEDASASTHPWLPTAASAAHHASVGVVRSSSLQRSNADHPFVLRSVLRPVVPEPGVLPSDVAFLTDNLSREDERRGPVSGPRPYVSGPRPHVSGPRVSISMGANEKPRWSRQEEQTKDARSPHAPPPSHDFAGSTPAAP